MIKYKRLISVFLVSNFLFNFNSSCAKQNSSSIKSLGDNTISAKKNFKSLEKSIGKDLNSLTKSELQNLYVSCRKALTEEENEVFRTKISAFILSMVAFATSTCLSLFFEYCRNIEAGKICSLRSLEYKDVTDQTVDYQEDDSYNCFAIGSKKVTRTDIKFYTDAIKYFGNRKTHDSLCWSSETQKKVLEYLRLSGILGWSLRDTSLRKDEVDKPDAYLISALAKLALDFLSGDVDIFSFDSKLEDEMREFLPSSIYIDTRGDVEIRTFTFLKNGDNGYNGQGEYKIFYNKKDNRIIVFPQYDRCYYYVLDMNSHIDGHSEYPSLSRFFIRDDYEDETVVKSIHIPSAEKVQKIFDQSA